MNTKSVISSPSCPPTPAPPVPIAEGALHVPSARRATTTPFPYLAVPMKPPLITVRIARPWGYRLVFLALDKGVINQTKGIEE